MGELPLQPGELVRVAGRRGQYRVVVVNEKGHIQVLDRDEKSLWFYEEEVRRA